MLVILSKQELLGNALGGTAQLIVPYMCESSLQSTGRTKRTKPSHSGAVKSNIGHLGGSSGLAGVVKTILALENGTIPPNANFEKVNPNIDDEFFNLQVGITTLQAMMNHNFMVNFTCYSSPLNQSNGRPRGSGEHLSIRSALVDQMPTPYSMMQFPI